MSEKFSDSAQAASNTSTTSQYGRLWGTGCDTDWLFAGKGIGQAMPKKSRKAKTRFLIPYQSGVWTSYERYVGRALGKRGISHQGHLIPYLCKLVVCNQSAQIMEFGLSVQPCKLAVYKAGRLLQPSTIEETPSCTPPLLGTLSSTSGLLGLPMNLESKHAIQRSRSGRHFQVDCNKTSRIIKIPPLYPTCAHLDMVFPASPRGRCRVMKQPFNSPD